MVDSKRLFMTHGLKGMWHADYTVLGNLSELFNVPNQAQIIFGLTTK